MYVSYLKRDDPDHKKYHVGPLGWVRRKLNKDHECRACVFEKCNEIHPDLRNGWVACQRPASHKGSHRATWSVGSFNSSFLWYS